MLKRTDILAYTAGIVDGEGCINIGKRRRIAMKRGFEFALAVSVVNTNVWLCHWLRLQYGDKVYIIRRLPPKKDCWSWRLTSNPATTFLELILPYLKIKQPQAQIAIRFQKSRKRGLALTEEQATIQEAQFILMRNANKKGRPSE